MGVATADALTRTLFDTDLNTFLTEKWDGRSTTRTDNSWEVTLSELLNWGSIRNMGMSTEYNLQKAIMFNLKRNWIEGVVQIGGIKVIDKLMQRGGVYRNFNKFVRGMGLGQMVKA